MIKVNKSNFFGSSSQNCRSPAVLGCTLQGTCEVSLYTNIPIDDCNSQNADYIGITYRFIPSI